MLLQSKSQSQRKTSLFLYETNDNLHFHLHSLFRTGDNLHFIFDERCRPNLLLFLLDTF
jgi:hypothetical protein